MCCVVTASLVVVRLLVLSAASAAALLLWVKPTPCPSFVHSTFPAHRGTCLLTVTSKRHHEHHPAYQTPPDLPACWPKSACKSALPPSLSLQPWAYFLPPCSVRVAIPAPKVDICVNFVYKASVKGLTITRYRVCNTSSMRKTL